MKDFDDFPGLSDDVKELVFNRVAESKGLKVGEDQSVSMEDIIGFLTLYSETVSLMTLKAYHEWLNESD